MQTAEDLIARVRAMPAPARTAWLESDGAYQLVRDAPAYAALCAELRPPGLPQLAERLVARATHLAPLAQALVAAGLCARPDTEAYTLGLIGLPWVLRSRAQLEAMLDADPGLGGALLRVLDIEGTADTSLASSDKYCGGAELQWPDILLSLVERGATTRAELLHRSLAALENDWPQYRSGWHSRFHVRLKPSAAEMAPHRPRYLALCASRIPPTVTLALDVLATLDDASPFAAEALLPALRPVFASTVKAQVTAALKLLDRLTQREPACRPVAAEAVAIALVLEAPAVQKAVLQRLAAWGVDDVLRGRLLQMSSAIAAVNRPAWQALVGEATARAAPPAAAPRLGQPADPLDPARPLALPRDDAALVDLIAQVFEDDADVDAFEAALAAVVAGAPFDAARRRLLGPVLKRAPKVRKPLPRLLARLLLDVVEERTLNWPGGIDPDGNSSPALALLLQRVDALGAFARQQGRAVPLATPTHRRGFIAPAVLVARVAEFQARELGTELLEQALALLRLAPGAGEAERAAARQLRDEPLVRALRHALGDDVELEGPPELFAAAARIRHPGADDETLLRLQGDLGPDAARAARYRWEVATQTWDHGGKAYHQHFLRVQTGLRPRGVPPERLAVLRHPANGGARRDIRWPTFGGWDPGAIAWSATVLPSDLEAVFAEGARVIGDNLDWSEAQWHNAAYLRLLHDPTVPLGPMATLMLAAGLAGKEPGQTALAVDALVAAHAEGRLDVPVLAAVLRALLAPPLLKPARLAASLQAALRADASLRLAVFTLLGEAVCAEPPPRDAAALLELLLELKLALDAPLAEGTRAHLGAAAWSGRAKAACRALLA